MKKIIMLALVLSLFMGVSTARAAAHVDMTTMTCQEATSDEDGFMTVNLWLLGYLAGKTDHTILSGEVIASFTEKVADMCMERPEATLGDVINHLLQQ